MEKTYEQTPDGQTGLIEQIAEELEKVVGIDQERLQTFLGTLQAMPTKEIETILKGLRPRLGEKLLPLLEKMARETNETLAEIGISGLGNIPSLKAAQLLSEINDAHPIKALRKAARKSLYKLKSVGLEIETTVKPLLGAIKHHRYKALISPVDGTGTQLIFLTQEMMAGDLHFLQVVASDEDGIAECTSRRGMTKKMLAKLPETFAMQIGAHGPMLAETEYDFAMSLLLDAEKVTESLPEDYESNKEFFELSAAQNIANPVYQALKVDELKQQPNFQRMSADLFKEDHFLTWHLPLNELADYAQELLDQEDSAIEITPETRQERKEGVYQKVVEAKLTDAVIQRLRRRLEIMAYFFMQQQQTDDAQKALSAAITLGETPAAQLKDHPFIRELLLVSLDATRDVLESGYNPADMDRREYYLDRDDEGKICVKFVEEEQAHGHGHHHHDHDHDHY